MSKKLGINNNDSNKSLLELELYKKKCESLESEVFKLNRMNKKNDGYIKKLQDTIAKNGKVF